MVKKGFELNYKGIGELLKSKEMQQILSQHASDIRGRCGDGYEQDVYVGKTRANAMVRAETAQAKQDNLKNNTLLKAVR